MFIKQRNVDLQTDKKLFKVISNCVLSCAAVTSTTYQLELDYHWF